MRFLTAALAAALAAAGTPTIALDWSAYISQDLVQNQGSYALPNGDFCCSSGADACQVQVQNQAGQTYFSFTTNQTAQVFGAGSDPYAIVDDYNLGMEMAVDSTYTCTSFCPIDGPMEAFSVDGFTDLGPATIDGVVAELWQYDNLFPILNVTVEVQNVYLNQTNPAAAFPLKEVDDLTPFGENLGQSNTTYTAFKAGPQPPKWFAVQGVAACQEGNNCNSNSVRQLHRLSMRRKSDFIAAHFRAKVAAAERDRAAAAEVVAALEKRDL